MIGYVQLYIKIIAENNTYYAMFDGDFGKPITRRALRSIKKSFHDTYSKLGVGKIYEVSFCTKEEYEANDSDEEYITRWINADA